MLTKFLVSDFMNFKCAWTLDLSEPNNYEFNPEVVSKDAITKAIVY